MLEIISSKKEITECQNLLIKQLKKICGERVKCKVGFQGGALEMEVFYSKEYNFWFCSKNDDNKYWNAFGLGQPREGKTMTITVEVNPPLKGINRRLGGQFCINESGNRFLMHTGNIGGGREGIGKALFTKWFGGPFEDVKDENRLTRLVLVAELRDHSLGKQISSFIREVDEIKTKRHESFKVFEKLDSYIDEYLTTDEPTGKRKAAKHSNEEVNLIHGEVVNALKAFLLGTGFIVERDRRRDLCILDEHGAIATFFEIKSSNSDTHVYTALGQLLFYNMLLEKKARLVMVIPQRLPEGLESKINQLGITIQYYTWKNGKPDFTEFKMEKLRLT